VPARTEVYEYIIFKASDIKDLVVCETPQPVPTLGSGLPYDPAIVSISKVRFFFLGLSKYLILNEISLLELANRAVKEALE
jgi:hypothetical protein